MKAPLVKKRRPRLTPQDFLAAGLGKLPDTVVARKLDTWPQSVYLVRKRLGIPYDRKAMRKLLPTRQRYDWLSVDWSQTNVAIARSLGCCDHTVQQKRCNLRRAGHPIPRSPYPFLVKPSRAIRRRGVRAPR